ncbi:thermonuclease family protein [Sphingorhabdus pulchriflava]|uniref:Thermonuclease family protein n=1 Tax=Sphingorhabdus pulchriflava TaxID=2292257 RepID=A0A371BFS1_9SPHN|nr:thermonuclease family protein [Sphingorhabdus pulchriflava]RDV06455.1 thermonuclease family protein [Sphingorhabdus pulchriflava]
MFFAAAILTCTAPIAVDGDTLRCRDIGLVRLLSIDAPEMPGHCRQGRECTPGDGAAAKRGLSALIRGKRVTCITNGHDSYGRLLARCEAGGVDLGCAMVASGHAVERYGRLRCR